MGIHYASSNLSRFLFVWSMRVVRSTLKFSPTYLDYYRAVSCNLDALCIQNFASGLRVKSGYQTLILMSRSSENLSESVTGRGSRTEFEFEFFLKHSILP